MGGAHEFRLGIVSISFLWYVYWLSGKMDWSIVPRFEKGLCIIIPVFEERDGPRGPKLWRCSEMTQTAPNA